jgi:hypothetical protein
MITTLIASAILAQASLPATPAPTITGQLTLIDHRIGMDGSECYGMGGFRDIRGTMPVVVKDAEGKILAVGKTAIGRRVDNVSCVFDYSVADVPKASFYQIQFGRRGGIIYPLDRMVKSGWVVNAILSRG